MTPTRMLVLTLMASGVSESSVMRGLEVFGKVRGVKRIKWRRTGKVGLAWSSMGVM